jgi:hypothetical protein
MPRIRPVELREGVAGPIDRRRLTGDDIDGGAGKMVSAIGQGVGAVGEVLGKREEQAELSDLHAKFAKTYADFSNQWQETLRTAKPGDKGIVENFMKGFDDHIGEMESDVSTAAGRNFFKAHSAQLRADFTEKTVQGQAHLAGVKAFQDVKQAGDSYAATVLNDPSSLPKVVKYNSEGLDAAIQKHNLSSEQAEKIRNEQESDLYKSAARGWIKLNPQVAKQKLDGGEFDQKISGDVKTQLYGEIRVAESAAAAEAERVKKAEKEALEAQREATKNGFVEKLQKNELAAQEIVDSNLDAAGKEHYLNLLKVRQTERIKTDPKVFLDTLARIHLPANDPKRLDNEDDLVPLVGNGLTFENLQQFRAEIQGKKTQSGEDESRQKVQVLNIAKGFLTKTNDLTGFRDPIGDEQFARWQSFMLTEDAKLRKDGVSAYDRYNPDGKFYLGNSVRQFIRSPQQQMQDMIRLNTPAKPAAPTTPTAGNAPGGASPKNEPRRPDESPADYLKRIGVTK